MKILEVKNNLVKISYNAQDNLVISGFVIVEDLQYAYVAQVMSLKADSGFNYAIVKLLFTFNDEGVVKNYNGSIPELDATITPLSSDELLDILPIETPLTIGKLAQQNFILNIDFSALEKNLIVCSDNVENTDILISNFAKQLTANNNKSVIFDTTSTINAENRLTFGVDFKLPLNYDTINFIYEHDLNDINPASKAIIQDILIEVQEYADTLIDKFIPFDLFMHVIDSQYKQTQMPELALLKSKLVKYKEENIFAQEAREFHSFRAAIRGNLSTLIDISKVDSLIQKLVLTYAYSEIDSSDLFMYSLVKINNDNSDKKLMKKLITDEKISTTIVCPHNYKYVRELKEVANNLILFTPQTVQHDFAAYNVFLNKLNPDEAIIYGKATQNIPLIIEVLPFEDLVRLGDEYREVSEPTEIVESVAGDTFDNGSDTYTQESLINDVDNTESAEDNVETAGSVETIDSIETVEEETTSQEIQEDSQVDEGVPFEQQPGIEENFVDVDEQVSDDSDTIDVPEDNSVQFDVENQGDFEETQDNEVIVEEPVAEDEIIENEIAEDNIGEDVISTDNSFEQQNDEFAEFQSNDDFQSEEIKEDIISDEEFNSEDIQEDVIQEEIPQEDGLGVENHGDITSEDDTHEEFVQDEVQDDVIPQDNDTVSIQEDEAIEDDSAQPVQEEFIESEPKDEEIPSITEESEDVLTEQDLDFIDSNPNIDNEEDFGTTESQNIVDDIDDFSNSAEEFEQPVSIQPEDSETVIQDSISEEYPALDTVESQNNNYQQESVVLPQEDLLGNDFENQDLNMDDYSGADNSNVVPIYPAEDETPISDEVPMFEQGDRVSHPKYGEGVVEKMVKFGNKVLCSINFANGRRLLDPTISQIERL